MIGALKSLQRRFELTLPGPMTRFYERPRKLRYLTANSLSAIRQLKVFDIGIPPRIIPLFWTACGNSLGVCFPRDGGSPFVVGYDHEESIAFPLTGDLSRFFRDPDLYSHDHPVNKNSYPKDDWRPCRRLLVRRSARVPELEFLKPMWLHYRMLERGDDKVFSSLVESFGASQDPRAKAVRKTFSSASQLNDRKRWILLSKELLRAGYPVEAIQALEACLTLQVIYPWYGEWPKRGEPNASKEVEVYSQLLPLIQEHGDEFDRLVAEEQLKGAKLYARQEKRRAGKRV